MPLPASLKPVQLAEIVFVELWMSMSAAGPSFTVPADGTVLSTVKERVVDAVLLPALSTAVADQVLLPSVTVVVLKEMDQTPALSVPAPWSAPPTKNSTWSKLVSAAVACKVIVCRTKALLA